MIRQIRRSACVTPDVGWRRYGSDVGPVFLLALTTLGRVLCGTSKPCFHRSAVGLNLAVWTPNWLACRQIRGEAAVWLLSASSPPGFTLSARHISQPVPLITDAVDKRRLKGPAEGVSDRSLLAWETSCQAAACSSGLDLEVTLRASTMRSKRRPNLQTGSDLWARLSDHPCDHQTAQSRPLFPAPAGWMCTVPEPHQQPPRLFPQQQQR